MNFYSDEIVNTIVDGNLEQISTKMEEFYQKIFELFYGYSHRVICPNYVFTLLTDLRNKIVFRCIDTEFNIENCPSMLIYHKHYDKMTDELAYYILMICTKPKFKKYGYASKMLDDFIQHIKRTHEQSEHKFKDIKVILSSVETAVTFYETYGFRWTREPITNHKILMRYEKYDAEKEYFILELSLFPLSKTIPTTTVSTIISTTVPNNS